MKFPSNGFCFCVISIAIWYPFIALSVARNHLTNEQVWTAKLQEMINHDMEIVARQNKLINDMFAYCYKLEDQISNNQESN